MVLLLNELFLYIFRILKNFLKCLEFDVIDVYLY